MQPEYSERNDHLFGIRFMSTALVCSIPVWIGLVIAVWRGWSLPARLLFLS